MNRELLIYSAIMLTGVFISSIAQVLLKQSAGEKHRSMAKEYLNPKVIIAYAILLAATLLGVYAYTVVPLMLGTILDAAGYIFVTIFAVTIFKEKISSLKLLALFLIVSGIVVYALGG